MGDGAQAVSAYIFVDSLLRSITNENWRDPTKIRYLFFTIFTTVPTSTASWQRLRAFLYADWLD
jgi:hypothetical protein